MLLLKQSESTAARRRIPMHCVDATDGITPELGEAAGQPQVSKNGGTFANTAATLVSVGNGLYYVELTTGELDTLGWIVVRYKSAATAEVQVLAQVAAFDPFAATGLGLSNLDVAVSTRSSLTGANIRTEVETVLNTAIPGTPTSNSPYERIKTLDDSYTSTRAASLDNCDVAVSTRATPAQVNAEVVDVLRTDTSPEPSASAPPATATIQAKIDYLYTQWRNRFTTTNAERKLYGDDGATVLCKSAISDNGTIYDRGEFVAP